MFIIHPCLTLSYILSGIAVAGKWKYIQVNAPVRFDVTLVNQTNSFCQRDKGKNFNRIQLVSSRCDGFLVTQLVIPYSFSALRWALNTFIAKTWSTGTVSVKCCSVTISSDTLVSQ